MVLTTSLKPSWRFILSHPAYFLAFGGGAGLSPKAPGTLGTLIAVPIYALLIHASSLAYLAFMLFLFVLGVKVCAITGRALGVADHGGMVWDEIVAFLLVLPFAPFTLLGWGVAFGLFRLFDIWKPFPIAYLERKVKGGLGVMLDDVLAAGYSIILLKLFF